MRELSVTEYHLKLARELYPNETPQLRGFFGNEFAEHILLHQHNEDGTLIYNYPRIQFKILNRQAVLVGLEEGSALLAQLWLEVDQAQIGLETLSVQESIVQKRRVEIGESKSMVTYRFLSPWLALNQENEHRYRTMPKSIDRFRLLERILVGNCLSFAKSFQHNVTLKLTADCSKLRPVSSRLKGITMQGFTGSFSVNFLLPDRVGIGKSVSRGFGTLVRAQNAKISTGGSL